MSVLQERLRITEIFHSIQGESAKVGIPTVFVRLTGCPLRCQYCDTAYAFNGGSISTFDDIHQKVMSYQCKHICITGGEPLAQPNCNRLMTFLCDKGYHLSIETSGSRDISEVDKRVHVVMDIKTPDSKESAKNLWDNLAHLKAEDEIKFVLCSQEDYAWAKQILKNHRLTERFSVIFSPSWDELPATQLADWIVKDKLDVRFGMQLHKILWEDAPGR